jgi:hypothetical protein
MIARTHLQTFTAPAMCLAPSGPIQLPERFRLVIAPLSGSSDARTIASLASIPRPDKSASVALSAMPQRETRLGLEHMIAWSLVSCSLPMRLPKTLVTDRALISGMALARAITPTHGQPSKYELS